MLLIFHLCSCHGEENQNASKDIIYNSTTAPSDKESQNASNVIIHNSTTAPTDIEFYNKLNISFYKALHLPKKNDGLYSISEKSLEVGDNKIIIPQISDMDNLDKQEEINSLIRENINKEIFMCDERGFFEFKYSTKFKNNKLLSFLFEADYFVKGDAHPTLFSFGINIDLDNSSILEKKNIIFMDEDVAKMLNDGDFVPQNEISESFYPIYLNVIDKEDTLSVLETSDMCFSDEGIEFIIETNYATGGYMLLLLPYKLLE